MVPEHSPNQIESQPESLKNVTQFSRSPSYFIFQQIPVFCHMSPPTAHCHMQPPHPVAFLFLVRLSLWRPPLHQISYTRCTFDSGVFVLSGHSENVLNLLDNPSIATCVPHVQTKPKRHYLIAQACRGCIRNNKELSPHTPL